ncbi:hypothetical protein Mapa_006105 [Marchantia paleacea]|nr:hypothetical protein Mapa_006105 [Marchantia paleacea]
MVSSTDDFMWSYFGYFTISSQLPVASGHLPVDKKREGPSPDYWDTNPQYSEKTARMPNGSRRGGRTRAGRDWILIRLIALQAKLPWSVYRYVRDHVSVRSPPSASYDPRLQRSHGVVAATQLDGTRLDLGSMDRLIVRQASVQLPARLPACLPAVDAIFHDALPLHRGPITARVPSLLLLLALFLALCRDGLLSSAARVSTLLVSTERGFVRLLLRACIPGAAAAPSAPSLPPNFSSS